MRERVFSFGLLFLLEIGFEKLKKSDRIHSICYYIIEIQQLLDPFNNQLKTERRMSSDVCFVSILFLVCFSFVNFLLVASVAAL